jgi:integrase
MLGATSWDLHEHTSKQALLARLPSRLSGYASWLPPNWRIVILVDRDADDCKELKARLEAMAFKAGLQTRSSAGSRGYTVINRIASEELEAWFFGDWAAVRAAYPRVAPGIPSKARFRKPDEIRGGTWEALEAVLQQAGYFTTGLRKMEAAAAIAQRMEPARNTSPSFRAFREAVEVFRS